MNSRIIRIATRQSPLALWQANHVRDEMLKKWPELNIELLPMTTSGDQFLKDKLLDVGGKALFVKELEEALLDKRADFAVHSAKDMPAEFPQGLSLAAICKRDNPFDVLVSTKYSSLEELPLHAIVGTSSLRRQSQLLAYRPDLCIKPLRGNINTRLATLKQGEYQAIILAAAGLERMGFKQEITEQLSEQIMLPACGQGALAIECRTDDLEIQALITQLNDPISAICVHTERHVNALLGGNCNVPVAVFCVPFASNQLFLHAKVLNQDGSQIIQHQQTGEMDKADSLASQCAQSLLNQGAANLLAGIPKWNRSLQGLRVLNTRPYEQAQDLSAQIRQAGGVAIELPALSIEAIPDWLLSAPDLKKIQQAIFTSRNAVKHCFEQLIKHKIHWPETIEVIAIGQGSAATLKKYKVHVHIIPTISESEHLLALDTFSAPQGKNILLIKGAGGRLLIEESLRARGANLITLSVYQRITPKINHQFIKSIWRDDLVDIILLTSVQSMHNLFKLFKEEAHHWLCSKTCLVFSERMAQDATALGIKNIIRSHPDGIMNALFDYVIKD